MENKAISLTTELETRARVRREFEKFVSEIDLRGGLSVADESDLDALASLLLETRETIKKLQKDEEILKEEIKRHFPEGQSVLPCGRLICFLQKSSRSYLDRDAIARDFGPSVIAQYTKETPVVSLKVQAIREG